ncbi:hypothetical protein [Marinospirillum insulare]|uniref:Uncharacterized protein n=1 Tax=Marinospirillum insulare TaxID=217169 RepID=A0ABQ6A4Q6_9GAMM|nr:hypothetical protein [Marinospirillum insulare]GLR65099.1 hypothetical protein GCM10007878_25380 [Marinospirillum insulare]
MNSFLLQGRLIYREPPKRDGGSILILLETGIDKEKNNKQIQNVNKVIVRVPYRLVHVFDAIDDDAYLELTGNLLGRVYYSMGSKTPIGTLNLVCSGVQVGKLSHKIKPDEVAKHLFSDFTMSGLVRGIQPPAKDHQPFVLFLQIERPITRNEGELSQPSAIIPVVVPQHKAHLIKSLEPQDFVVVSGGVSSTLRKMPIPDVPGEFEERLEASVQLTALKKCAIIPNKIFESRKQRAERELNEKHQAENEVVKSDA